MEGKPYKPLTTQNKSVRGRNNMGRITSRNHGGGHKQKYRIIDFYRKNLMYQQQSRELNMTQIDHVI